MHPADLRNASDENFQREVAPLRAEFMALAEANRHNRLSRDKWFEGEFWTADQIEDMLNPSRSPDLL